MTASHVSPILLTALALAAMAGCRTPAGAPPPSAFDPARRSAPTLPDAGHATALDVARAALVGDRAGSERALTRLGNIERVLAATGEAPTGLYGAASDVHNANSDDRLAYTAATRALLADREDLDPALRARLELFRDDQPLEIAADRMRDDLLMQIANAFNALAEPVGRSIMSTQMAPYRLGRSLMNYAVLVYTRDPLPLQQRQARTQWRDFVARHPDAPQTEQLEPRVRDADRRFRLTQRDRALRTAEKALALGKVRLALVYADRALRFVPEDRRASELRDEAARQLLALREGQRRSVEAAATDPLLERPDATRRLALALLLPQGDAAGVAREIRRADPDGPLESIARYVEAMARGETGERREMWDELEELADGDEERDAMTRHAQALVGDPEINTWRAFRTARNHDRWSRFKWVWVGYYFGGFPDRGLPGKLEWIVDAPSLLEQLAGTPARLLELPWARALPSAQLAATTARRHLAREPEGEEAEDARDWLIGYEERRGNWVAVHELRSEQPGTDPEELEEAGEEAAQQYLSAALREPSRGLRMGMYLRVGRIYPTSEAARTAAELVREEARERTPQRIGISREFLLQNPDVAGPLGIGLRPELLDGDTTNAELHPEGVTLLGARAIRVAYIAPSGDEDDEPRHVDEAVDGEHLARIVSQLEETAYRNMLLDPLDDVGVDARRDLYFERVRLGLADEADPRPAAGSEYTYRGLRERYGMVRAGESILPFDLVFQGSLSSFSLGAFPRMRPPRETPDAFLYR